MKKSVDHYAAFLRHAARAERAAARYILARAREGADLSRLAEMNLSTHPNPEGFLSYVAARRDHDSGLVKNVYDAFSKARNENRDALSRF